MISIYDIWFSNLDISNGVKLRLLEKFKNTKIVWSLNKNELLDNGFKEISINKILDSKYRKNIDK